jgi:predicted Zn-dependent peptidase
MELFAQALWPDHPLGRPILGTKASVRSFRAEDLHAFFRSAYGPASTIVAAAGRLEHDEVAGLVERHLSGLHRARPSRPGPAPRPVRRLVTRTKRELEQVHLCVGVPSYPHAHPDRYGLYVLNTILGGSMSSRLFQNVREKRGLVYSISSGVSVYSDAGLLSVYAATGLDRTDEVLRLTVEEMRRLRGEEVPADELRRAKDHLKGSLVLALESTGSRMSHLARQEISFGRLFPIDEILDGVEAVTAADVARIAGDLLRGRLHASVVGNLRGWKPRPARLEL